MHLGGCGVADLPRMMIAIDPAAPGGPEVLVPVERPVPSPAAGEVLIKVAAAGVNRPDVFQRRGFYPPPPGAPSILGLELDKLARLPVEQYVQHSSCIDEYRVRIGIR